MKPIHAAFRASVLSFALLGVACTLTPTPHDTPRAAGVTSREPARDSSATWRYAVVIDASSSASTLQVFEWSPGDGRRLPRIEPAPRSTAGGGEPWEMRVRPGLGSYRGQPRSAAASLEPLLEFAREKIGDDPETLAGTRVLVRATAGMRLLPPAEQSEILAEVDSLLAATPFGDSSARVISGDEEGVYGWIAVNYLLGHLEHGGRFPTVGSLDLGGASAQITFQPLDYPGQNGHAFSLGSNTYHLYSKSYLGLGQDQARETVASPSCFLIGYPTPWGPGTGDFDACREAILQALQPPCSEDEAPCSILDADQPPAYGDYLALSAYAYVSDFFELAERLRPEELEARGRAYCGRDWNSWVAEEPVVVENSFLPNYCYSAAHIVVLLTEGHGFPADTDRITAPLRVQGAALGWSLGALLYELAATSAP